MGLESATFIHQLNAGWPIGSADPKAEGDNHLRLIKSTLQATFPNLTGAMTLTQAILNQWGGLAAAYTWTGNHAFKGSNVPVVLEHANMPRLQFLKTGIGSWYLGGDGTASNDLAIGLNATVVGKVGVNGQLMMRDQGLGDPAYSFIDDPDTGLFRNGANQIGFTTGGTLRFNISATELVSRVPMLAPAGAVGAPSYSWESDPTTGFWRAGAGDIGVALAGVQRMRITAGNLTIGSNVVLAQDGAVGGPSYSFQADVDTGMYRIAAETIGFATAGVLRFAVGTTNVAPLFPVHSVDGSAGAPSYSFNADTDTGIYRSGSNEMAFSEGAVGYRLGFRSVPRSTTATTLVVGDIGRCVAVSAAINIPASVFAAGDCLSIYNDSAASVNITISAGTLRLAGSATTGTRALAARGMATLWFNVGGATPEVICSGPGVS